MIKSSKNTEVLNYFRSNIFETISSYTAWKMLFFSKSKKACFEKMVEKYLEIQKKYPGFFGIAERALLFHFIVASLHPFDRDDDSHSFYKVDCQKTENFYKDNEKIIKSLKLLRNKLFAHRDFNVEQFKMPSAIDLNNFFDNLIKFYNELTSKDDNSKTNFNNAKEIKIQIESMFINLHRGEAIRRQEIDIKYIWENDNKKVSDIL